ncbi:tektin-1 [Brachyistius frenatus]|uniref:tektin-1 n=1 Tax=Brachyistius frenatus TaxID=100188 RepID=UPI0037E7C96F
MSVIDHSPLQDAAHSLMNAEVVLNHSELFRAECKRLILETDKACKRMQDDDTKRLDQRIRDIVFLKQELELKLEAISLETDALIALQNRVMKALEAIEEPLRVAVLCLQERKRRDCSARIYDEVERELHKEREVFEGVVSLLQRVNEQITEQLRLNRSAKYHLEQDLKEKFEAECIDNSCTLMTTNSIISLQKPGNITPLPSLAVTPRQWENISEMNIVKTENQVTNSVSLRVLVESLLEQTAADMQKQIQATTAAFQMNIQELKTAKSQMEEKLPTVLSEISNQQKIREDLQMAITNKEHFLSLARARLALRYQRPGKEQCLDPAQAQLLAEVQHLTAHIAKLRDGVAQSEEDHRALVRCQLKLQDDIQSKTNSLYIDEVICTHHREPVIIHNF